MNDHNIKKHFSLFMVQKTIKKLRKNIKNYIICILNILIKNYTNKE